MGRELRRGGTEGDDGEEEWIDEGGGKDWDGGREGGQDCAQVCESGRIGEKRAGRYCEASRSAEEAAGEDDEEIAARVALMIGRRFGSFRTVSGTSKRGKWRRRVGAQDGDVKSPLQAISRRLIFRGGALLALLLFFCAGAEAQWNPVNPVREMEKQENGVLLKMERGTLRIAAYSDSIVRVTYAPGV